MLCLAAIASTSFGLGPSSSSCPDVSSVGSARFNLTEFVRKSWFIQQQQVVGYQPLSSLFCVAATYDFDGRHVPFSSVRVATVYNYANEDHVNGPLQNSNNFTLCARAVNSTDSSRLAVAPCFLPNFFAGPYWVIGVGQEPSRPGEYTWAVIIGGEPTVEYSDGCTTRESGTNNAGLWLFSRSHVASKSELDAMYALLHAKGIATSRLHPVAQEGCTYRNAVLK